MARSSPNDNSIIKVPWDIKAEMSTNERRYVRLLESNHGCPALIYCVWKSGRHAVLRLSCKSWGCLSCAHVKVTEMTQLLADATIDNKTVHEVFTQDDREADAIKRFLRKRKISTLNIKLKGGLYIVASGEAQGKSWETKEITRIEALGFVYGLDRFSIRRRDFTLNWKPEPLYDPKRDTVIVSKRFSSLEVAKEYMLDFGQDLDSELIEGDPLDLMERMLKVGDDLTLQIGPP